MNHLNTDSSVLRFQPTWCLCIYLTGRFEVLRAMLMTIRSPLGHDGVSTEQLPTLRMQAPPKRRKISTDRHGIMYEETRVFKYIFSFLLQSCYGAPKYSFEDNSRCWHTQHHSWIYSDDRGKQSSPKWLQCSEIGHDNVVPKPYILIIHCNLPVSFSIMQPPQGTASLRNISPSSTFFNINETRCLSLI
jgi:hypothetical protein